MALIKPPPKKGGGEAGAGQNANPLKSTSPAPSPASPNSVSTAKKPPPPQAKPAGPPSGGPVKILGSSGPAKRPHKPETISVGSGRINLSTGKPKSEGELQAQLKREAYKADDAEAPDERIEDLALEIPGVSETKEPEIFDRFLEHIAPRLNLPSLSWGILDAFSKQDVTAEKVASVLKTNSYYEYQFQRVIESLQRRQERPALEAALILLGMQGSRNLLLALQILRMVYGTHAEFGKDGKLRISSGDVLHFALRTEETLVGNKDGYTESAFAAGMVFDVLSLIGNQLAEDKKKIRVYIDQAFSHGLRTAQIGASLVKDIPDFGHRKSIFAACMLHDVGKIALAILDPGYFSFLEECAKRDLPRAVREFAERKRFGVSHTVLGGLICHNFKVFRTIEKAVLFHHDPYMLRNRGRNLYELASMICLSTNVANHFKKVDKEDDPIIANWRGAELAGFRVDTRKVIAAIKLLV